MTPPSVMSPGGLPPSPALQLLSGKTALKDTNHIPSSAEADEPHPRSPTEGDFESHSMATAPPTQVGSVNVEMSSRKSLSTDNRGIYEGAGELHPWENNIDPDIARIQYDEDLNSLYLQVKYRAFVDTLQVLYCNTTGVIIFSAVCNLKYFLLSVYLKLVALFWKKRIYW